MRTLPSCSTLAREAREPLAGTASHARGCVLISYPKRMWARNALASEGLPRSLLASVERLADEHGVVTRLVAHEGPWTWRVEITLYPQGRRHSDVPLEDAGALLESARPDDGERLETPILACCTHGVRDRCCALFGMEIVRALRERARATSAGVEIREASHLGGDRFAPTLLVLPSGHTYGHLETSDAGALIDAALGAMPLRSRFRGSLWRDPLEQLADVAALSLAAPESRQAPQVGPITRTDEGDARATLVFDARVDARDVHVTLRCRREQRSVVGDCRSADQQRRGGVSVWAIEQITAAR